MIYQYKKFKYYSLDDTEKINKLKFVIIAAKDM